MPSVFATPLALLCALGGVALGETAAQAPLWPWVYAAAFGCMTLCAWRRKRWTLVTGLCTLVALFTARAAYAPWAPEPSAQAFEKTQASWRAQVVATPVVHVEHAGRARVHTTVKLLAQRREGVWYPEQGYVRVVLHPTPQVVRGDTVQICLQVRPLAVDNAFWQPSLHTLRVVQHTSAWATAYGLHVLLARGKGLGAKMDSLRQQASWALSNVLPAHVAGIVRALALGDTAGLTLAQRDAWADAGIAHLLAVSGLHVGLVACGLRWLVWRVVALWAAPIERFNLRAASAWLALPGVWAYVIFCGAPVSAMRAGIMVTATLMAQGLGFLPSAGVHALGFAGLLILAWDPYAGYSPSFGLSFVAVAALLSMQPLVPKATPSAGQPPKNVLRKALGGVAYALATGVITTVATAPLCITYFGRIPWLAPCTNLIAVPVGSVLGTPLALGFAALATMVSPHSMALTWAAKPVTWVLGGLDALATAVSAWPYAALGVGLWGLRASVWLAAALACLWGLTWCNRQAHKAFVSRGRMLVWACAVGGCAAWLWPGPKPALSSPHALTIWQLDVGQGDCTLMHLPDGGWVLIDGGGALFTGQRDPGRYVVAPALRALGVTRLKAVVLTHPHPDHMGGLAYVLARWPVDAFWRNAQAASYPSVQALDAWVRMFGGQVHNPGDQPVRWGKDISVRAYQPLKHRAASTNDHSIVLHLRYGPRSLLWMGDAEWAAEQALLPHLPHAEILKVGHHGSRTSTSQALLDAVAPEVALIACGARNTFGHPHAVTLNRLSQAGVTVLRTDVAHTIKLVSVGQGPWQHGTGKDLATLKPLVAF